MGMGTWRMAFGEYEGDGLYIVFLDIDEYIRLQIEENMVDPSAHIPLPCLGGGER